MTDYTTVQTATLKAIIAGTSFADTGARARVDELITLERLMLSPPEQRRYAGSVFLGQLRLAHPVVALQLEAELREGTILQPEEAERVERELRLQKADEERREQELAELRQRAEESAARRTWLAIGGLK